jgi:hypothetical protein
MVIRVQETYQELPGVRQGRASNPMDGPTATSIVAKQAQQTGQAMQRAASGFAEIVQAEQEKANKVRLNDAYNQASAIAHELRYNKDSGYLRLKGGDAVKGVQGDDGAYRPITESYGEKLGKELARIRNGLGNSALAQQFDIAAGDLSTKFRNDAVTYEAEQASAYETQVQDATIVTSANRLAADPFGASARLDRNRAVDAAVNKARAAGLQGKVVTDANDRITWEADSPLGVAVSEALGKVHTAVVDSLLEGKDVAGAKRYFEQHSGDFSTLDRTAAKEKLDTAWSAAQAIGAVDEVIAASGGMKPDDRDIEIEKMHAALRDRYKDDPEGLKAARAELDYRFSIHGRQQGEYDAGNVSSVWNQLSSGRSMASVEGTRAWLALPGDKRREIKAAWQREQDGEDMPGEEWRAWAQLMFDDQMLQSMSPAQITALEPRFGRKLTMQLLNQSNQVKADAAGEQLKVELASPKIDSDLFQAIATQYGLEAYRDNLTTEQIQELATFRSQLEDIVAKTQVAEKRIIKPFEMREFLYDAAAQIKSGKYALGYLPSYLQPSVALPAPGSAQAAAVAQYLQQRGLSPTAANQRKAMLDMTTAGQLLVDE